MSSHWKGAAHRAAKKRQQQDIKKGEGKGGGFEGTIETEESLRRKEEEAQRKRDEEEMRAQQAQYAQQAMPPGWEQFAESPFMDFEQARDPLNLDEDLEVAGFLVNAHHAKLPHVPNERSTLADAVKRGRLGFMAAGIDLLSQYLSIDVPAWEARAWQVTLVAMRFHGVTGGSIVQTQPADNQVASDVKALVEWGVDGAFESCLIDYPWAGICLSVTAAHLRVTIPRQTITAGGAQPGPQLGGFITPKLQAVQDTDVQRGPTFTTPTINLAVSPATSLVPVPARARGYRTYLVGDQGTSPDIVGVTIEQGILVGGAFTAFVLDQTGERMPGSVSNVAGGGNVRQDRQAAVGLSGLSTFLRIANTDPTSAINIRVEFLLDLG